MKKIIAIVLAGAIFVAIAGAAIAHSQQKDSVVSGIDLAAHSRRICAKVSASSGRAARNRFVRYRAGKHEGH